MSYSRDKTLFYTNFYRTINKNQQKSTEINQEITRNHILKSRAVADPLTFIISTLIVWLDPVNDCGISRVAMFGCLVLSVSQLLLTLSCMFNIVFQEPVATQKFDLLCIQLIIIKFCHALTIRRIHTKLSFIPEISNQKSKQ